MKVDTFGLTVALLFVGLINGCTRTTQQVVRLSDTTYIVRQAKNDNGLIFFCDVKTNPMCVPRKETP